ncbi:MAG: alpha/beta hydrolase-fold protein [Bacteroidota bacterium]
MYNPVLIVLCLLLLPALPGYAQSGGEIVIGNKYYINSEQLDEAREYWVSLPRFYNDDAQTHKTYPVLIILDGHSHFRPLSGALRFMDAPWGGGRRVPEMIVVGIPSTNRERDFTPDKIVTTRKNDTGGADQFLSFLEQELLPVLQDKYRVAPYNILVGHSLGGLFASHVYMKEDTAFNAFVAIDPSFGTWDVATMDQKVEATTNKSFDRFLYIATANWGTRNLRNRDRHVRFYEALNKKNPAPQFRAKLTYYEDEHHGSIPLIAFYNGIAAMFEGYGLTYRDVKSPEQLTAHYNTISDRLSFNFLPPESLAQRAGVAMLRSDDPQVQAGAIALLTLNTVNYPNSSNAFQQLGTAYAALDEKQNAIKNYQKCLEINPDDAFAQHQISLLRGEN